MSVTIGGFSRVGANVHLLSISLFIGIDNVCLFVCLFVSFVSFVCLFVCLFVWCVLCLFSLRSLACVLFACSLVYFIR